MIQLGSEWSISHNPPKNSLAHPIMGVRGVGAPLISPPIIHFIGGSESVKVLGVRGILIMWQLVFASRHCLILNDNKNNDLKGCVMVMADPLDLGHGKKGA